MTKSPGKGHNVIDTKQLREFVERFESLQEDKKEILESQKVVLGDAEHQGFDKKMIRKMVKIRAMDKEDRDEERELTDMYLSALGLL